MTETGWREKIGRGVSRWGKWILVLVIAASAVYWLRIRTVSVAGYTAVQGEIVAEVMGTGTLEAKVQTIVSTEIPGRIFDMRVDQGDHVRAGQALLRLDDSETREFLVDVEIEELPRNWSVGQRADAFIETARKDGVTMVPSQVITRNQGETAVVLNRDGRAVRQPVKTGLRGRTHVEIVEGLSPGEIVVTTQDSDPIPEGRRLEMTSRELSR